MALKASTGLRNKLLDTGSLKSIFAGGVIKMYAGAVPATADDSANGNTTVWTMSAINLAASASGGAITKDGTAWSAAASSSNTVTFYRLLTSSDTGGLSTTEARIQGTINTSGADLNLAVIALISSTTYTIDSFSISLPTP